MNTIIKLTNSFVDVPEGDILLEVPPKPIERLAFQWALAQGKELIGKLSSGTVAIWIDPDPLFIGIALMITTYLTTQGRAATWIIMENEAGWVLSPFAEEGADYLTLVKGGEAQFSGPKASTNISC